MKELPHSIEGAELDLITVLLLWPHWVPAVREAVKPPMFASQRHRLLFERICQIYDDTGECDSSVLIHTLESRSELNTAGGRNYLLEIASNEGASGHPISYADIIADKWRRRKLSLLGDKMRNLADSKLSTDELLQRIQGDISILLPDAKRRPHALSESILAHQEEMRRAEVSYGQLLGLGAGEDWGELDGMLRGLQPGRLYVPAGRPSQGKTTFVLNWAVRIARQDKAVLICSMEEQHTQIAGRILGEQGVKWRDEDGVKRVSALPIWIEDDSALRLERISDVARQWKASHSLQLLIVDYLQRVDSRMGDNREQRVAAVGRELKKLAMELNIPVILVSQLNREIAHRASKEPFITDLRESGAIEQDADVVLLLHWPLAVQDGLDDDTEAESWIKMIVAKNRSGPVGEAWFRWRPADGRFLYCSKQPEVRVLEQEEIPF